MGISKTVIFFAILGLAICGGNADLLSPCIGDERSRAERKCGAEMKMYSGNGVDNMMTVYRSCIRDEADVCRRKVIVDCKCPKCSHASSTSAANITFIIAAVAALVPFM